MDYAISPLGCLEKKLNFVASALRLVHDPSDLGLWKSPFDEREVLICHGLRPVDDGFDSFEHYVFVELIDSRPLTFEEGVDEDDAVRKFVQTVKTQVLPEDADDIPSEAYLEVANLVGDFARSLEDFRAQVRSSFNLSEGALKVLAFFNISPAWELRHRKAFEPTLRVIPDLPRRRL